MYEQEGGGGEGYRSRRIHVTYAYSQYLAVRTQYLMVCMRSRMHHAIPVALEIIHGTLVYFTGQVSCGTTVC